MNTQIRSADLMVKSVLSDPSKIEALRQDPEKAIKALAAEATRQLPEPTQPTTDWLWTIIVCSFSLVMIGSAFVLASTLTIEAKAGVTYITRAETIVTLFTTTVAFLAGLLSPSPVKNT